MFQLEFIRAGFLSTTNRQGCSLVKNYTFRTIYATLYMKLIACLTFISRGLERPGRIGVIYLAISNSISGGIFDFNRNSRHICTATEKLTL